jgi:carboxymethylenebutenolidase
MRRFLFAICLLLLPVSVFAANPEQVSFTSGDETVHGWLYLPSGKGPHPALIVIHEWWGLNEQIKGEDAWQPMQVLLTNS